MGRGLIQGRGGRRRARSGDPVAPPRQHDRAAGDVSGRSATSHASVQSIRYTARAPRALAATRDAVRHLAAWLDVALAAQTSAVLEHGRGRPVSSRTVDSGSRQPVPGWYRPLGPIGTRLSLDEPPLLWPSSPALRPRARASFQEPTSGTDHRRTEWTFEERSSV